jgi:hypothetical protein
MRPLASAVVIIIVGLSLLWVLQSVFTLREQSPVHQAEQPSTPPTAPSIAVHSSTPKPISVPTHAQKPHPAGLPDLPAIQKQANDLLDRADGIIAQNPTTQQQSVSLVGSDWSGPARQFYQDLDRINNFNCMVIPISLRQDACVEFGVALGMERQAVMNAVLCDGETASWDISVARRHLNRGNLEVKGVDSDAEQDPPLPQNQNAGCTP